MNTTRSQAVSAPKGCHDVTARSCMTPTQSQADSAPKGCHDVTARSRMTPALPAAAWTVALSGLSGMGPARLSALLARWAPAEAWVAVASGTALLDVEVARRLRRAPPGLAATWQGEAGRVDVAERWSTHQALGIGVATPGEACFPDVLADDPDPPGVIFYRGDLGALRAPRVAIVGTRHCTASGRAVATELGRDLAEAGVCVVSGLATGIDGAAHRGALATVAAGGAAPAGVVGSGLDVVYPRSHAQLWSDVAGSGVLICEYPLGVRPARWRFPARNRIIAALADVVVVVESHSQGGSMHTVESALERDRTVMAVPGPVRSPASRGTNALLAAGSAVCRDATDVLVTLGLDASLAARAKTPTPEPLGRAGAVLAALGWEPATIETVADRLDTDLGPVAVVLAHLEADGWINETGGWYERCR